MISIAPAGLFRSVPDADYLGFWDGGRLNPNAVVRFLRFSKADVARIAAVSPASVRFDHKIPADVLDRLTQIASVCGLVAQHFDGDASKTALWFTMANPSLDHIAPREMILLGRYEALRRFVVQALEHSAAGRMTTSDGPAAADGFTPADVVAATEADSVPPLILSHQASISALCLRYGVRQLSLPGSILRAQLDSGPVDGETGNVDLIVEFGPPGHASAAPQYADFRRELERLLARPLDLLELSAMQDCRLKRIIQRTLLRIYGVVA
jgi:predicted nucleotidyltransferase